MKKYLFSALALPLLFACSSEDLYEKEFVGNDQFKGIEKVDATFFMGDEGATTRMNTEWGVEIGDQFGFAWMGTAPLAVTGNAYQNHPLTVEYSAERGSNIFKPQTSIYVGKYYIYRPYDETTVDIQAINFNSLKTQTLADGANTTWNSVAKNAILIGDKWTNVTTGGTTISGKTWDKAGINNPFQVFSAFFSNQTALDLTYTKNNPAFAAAKVISGATDINYTIAAGETVGAADITKVTVKLAGAANSFTYAPTAEPNTGTHKGSFWEDKNDLNTNITGAGFTFADAAADVITLNAPDGAPVSTGAEGNKGWFWFNSLPVSKGSATSATNVQTVFTTSYGTVTVTKNLAQCAWAYEDITPTAANHEIGGSAWNPAWIQLAAADAAPTATTPRKWDPAVAAGHNTFVNQYGNHKGKYAFTVDFSGGIMNNMHITDDTHLQKALRYYLASGKTEGVVLNLDADANGEFKISKISIALIQTIYNDGNSVTVQACGTHGTPKIIITQDGQAALGLADAKEVPALDHVFAATTDVFLSSACEWTWSGDPSNALTPYETPLAIDGFVNSITNEGTLTVNAKNVQLSQATKPVLPLAPVNYILKNAAGATMNITKVTTVKNALTNLGTINVPAGAELRAYGVVITNDATGLNAQGRINNSGVVGVTYGTSPAGKFNNYGTIDMKTSSAITLLSSNETTGATMDAAWAAGNKRGTVLLPDNNPTALVSVSNAAETGFIKYNWTAGTTYAKPAGNVKYNTIVVSSDITFRAPASEVQFIEFTGTTRTQVVNPQGAGYLNPTLKGIIVAPGKGIIIEKGNEIVCSEGAHLGDGAAVYQGGLFTPANTNKVGKIVTDYLGSWSTDQVVVF